MRYLFLCTLLVFPCSSFAAVTINEVAWMGDEESANHEWIELYNDGTAAVDVTGWEVSDGMKLSIVLTGTISPQSYAVLERTDDTSAQGDAFMVYTGALVNTGATLTLKRSDGSLEDQVGGGENWQNIGGDNATKETAQYTTSGWITAAATPGKTNATTGTPKQTETTTSKTTTQSNGVKATRIEAVGEPVRLILPDVTLKLTIDAQTVGYVNQTIDFSVEPSGIGDNLIDSLTYVWNFGDGLTSGGKKASHTFSYPGTYVVTVYGSFKRQEQVARHEITILPVTISLTQNAKGAVQINNDSPYEIDISGYTLRASKNFVFPPRSVVLPNQTVTIGRQRVGAGTASLFDARGSLVVREGTESLGEVARAPFTAAVSVVPRIFPDITGNPVFSFATTTETAASSSLGDTSPVIGVASTTRSQKSTTNTLPYLGLIGLIAVGTIGVLVKPRT